ncbi:LCP family glycopolymer transferase [Shouchella shacheensis]|uniref:LCP family glycopolymer transferase n=1 Tax=Shouchella shacheensis TaxID=1649580 RepID=UPI00073FD1D3|nr:LCP family protein [Shouchella shacheensis]
MKKAIKIISLIVGVLFLAAIGVGWYLYSQVSGAADRMHSPIEGREGGSERRDTQISSGDPMSVLIAGIDARPDEGLTGRSDSMILVTVNPNQESMKMLSIPRDTRAEIVGHGTTEKINHAYAHGGAGMAMDSVENLFDVPIDHFVSLNMEGFETLIDALGGIRVNNEFEFSNEGYQFSEGEQFLNGSEALAYTRMRYEDPRGDAGRAARQREIVEGVIEEGAQFSSVTRAGDILDILGDSVKTDLSLNEMWDYQSDYRSAVGTTDQIEVAHDGARLDDGLWYAIVPDEEIARVRAELREHLELEV